MKNFLLGCLLVLVVVLGAVAYLQATGHTFWQEEVRRDTVALAQGQIGIPGGQIVVTSDRTALRGLALTIPQGALDGVRQVRIAEAPLPPEDRAEGIGALTPMIEIDAGHAYASDWMTLRIPITLPDGHFAMACLVDRGGRILEGLPVIDLQANAVTVATRHFSRLAVFSIAETILTGRPTVHTGFSPGEDDWSFPNHGSVVKPRGHCAGQSISAMYYYYEKRVGERAPPLHGHYDEGVSVFWVDDAQAYMLASTAQADLAWGSWTKKTLKTLGQTRPELVWHAFLFAMLATGEPQLVGVYRTTPPGGGHALIAYKVTVAPERILHVVDPNFPGEQGRRREIRFGDNGFESYVSASNGQETTTSQAYDLVCYFGKTVFADWHQLGTRWKQLEAGTIASAYFPRTRMLVVGEDERSIAPDQARALDADYRTEASAITLRPQVLASDGSKRFGRITVFREEDLKAEAVADSGDDQRGVRLSLALGPNRFGLWTRTRHEGTNAAGQGVLRWKWSDFQWVEVTGTLAVHITPAFLQGRVGKLYRFTLERQNKPLDLEGVRYEWAWGDSQVVRSAIPRAQHAWKEPGPYTLGAKVIDDQGRTVASASTTLRMHAAPTKDTPPARSDDGTEPSVPPKPIEETHEVAFSAGYTPQKGGTRFSKDITWNAPSAGKLTATYTYANPIGSNLGYNNGHYVAWLRWKSDDKAVTKGGRSGLPHMSHIKDGKFAVRESASTRRTIAVGKAGKLTFTLVPEITQARKNSDGSWHDDYYQAKHYHCLGGNGSLHISFVPSK